MRLSHLSDSEIQSYLDRKETTPDYRSNVDEHLSFCDDCRESTQQYDQIYAQLSFDDPGEFSDDLVNSIMLNLPKLPGQETWRLVLPWVTRFTSFVLFIAMLVIPYDIKLPSITLPAITWSTFSLPAFVMPDIVTRMMEMTGAALSPERLPFYMFMLLFGLIFYNLERIMFGGLQRSRVKNLSS